MSDIRCNVGAINTGQACVPVMKVQKKWIFVQTYNRLGVLNEMDLTAGPFNAAYFALRVNDPDASQRWFPLPSMKNVSDQRADSLMETFDDGSKVFIEQGIRSATALIVASDAPPQMVKKIRGFRGVGMSIFAVDKESNLLGKVGTDATKFTPVQLEADTIDAIFVKSEDKTIQKIKIMFDININEDDSELRMIQSTEMAYDLSNLRGLVDITPVFSAITTAGFTVALFTDAGTPLNPVMMEGLVTADFVSSVGGATGNVRDTTSGADKVVTVVESAPGVYDVTFAVAAVTGHVIVVKPLKDGYDFTAVEADPITIP